MSPDPGVGLGRAPACVADPVILHVYFARSVRRFPERIAVDVPPGRGRPERTGTTYAQLDEQATALAARLAPLVAADSVVGILLPRDSARLYAAQLAVLQAGAAFTCLDPGFPPARARDILDDAAAVALLTDGPGALRARAAGFALPVIDVADVLRSAPPATRPSTPAWVGPESLAYLIYTSGTTGRPKGVMIEHRGIANLVASDLAELQLTADDRVVQGSSPAYDSSVEETWLALAAGATVVVMDDDAARLGPDLVGWLRRERATVFCPPPTLLRATGCVDPETELPDLRLLYVGGEALPRDVADRWSRGPLLVNGYGPTECTVTCLRARIDCAEPITIGRPVAGVQAWVLRESGDEASPHERGELWIGGVGLARGYWRQPELTAEKFVTHPGRGRLYRTGDLAHRDESGRFFYHGRLDAQAKIRGHRVELGEIETHLLGCAGVRAAACRLQGEAGREGLVAFVVPADPLRPPTPGDLRAALSAALPGHMVPARFGFLAALPTSVGGKLDRAALPVLDDDADAPSTTPRSPLEASIAAAMAEALRRPSGVSIDEDFFGQLGGDSIRAAELVTLLRAFPATAWITVRDVYATPTVAGLAARAPRVAAAPRALRTARPDVPRRQVLLAGCVQGLWLLATFVPAAIAAWAAGFVLLPALASALGLVPLLVLAPLLSLLGFALYTPLSVAFAVAVKQLLVGRYRPLRAAAWSGFYVRSWIVQQAVRLVPWSTLEGTVFQHGVLRALGARIGARVHIHRGVDLLRGGWDLLEIGDDVTLGQDAAVRVVDLDDGDIVVAPVSLGDGATLDVRAGVGGNTVLEPGAWLGALSSLGDGGRIPAGERWDGVPARPAGRAPVPPPLPPDARKLSPVQHGAALVLARAGLGLLLLLPVEILAVAACLAFGEPAEWSRLPGAVLASGLLAAPVTLAWAAVVMRMVGRVGEGVISQWSLAYVRVWLKTAVLDGASDWLSGTLLWPVWLRGAGMRVGRDCEISTIIDVVPELLTIGAESFLADGIYLGGPRIQRGIVTLAPTSVGASTFLGNHVVVPSGAQLPDDILLGVSTPADDPRLRAGSSWFGHPPFELPRREIVAVDRALTHEPSAIRYADRVFWELLRFALPLVPLLVLQGWLRALDHGAALPLPLFVAAYVPLVSLGAGLLLCGFVLALKWTLLGRVKPGQHALWSCWCSRWDFLYVAWGQHARRTLERFEGTPMLAWYLRAMGMRIGRGVVLGPGFAQVVDPDMIDIADGATVSAQFQAHTFEDRVLKIDRVVVGRQATLGSGTVPLYGTVVGEGTHVAPHSVVMKRERLVDGVRYEGAPTRPLSGDGLGW